MAATCDCLVRQRLASKLVISASRVVTLGGRSAKTISSSAHMFLRSTDPMFVWGGGAARNAALTTLPKEQLSRNFRNRLNCAEISGC
jgi:hypothetical protein